MKTKNNHTSTLLSGKTHPMIELFFEYAQLKNLYRQGWLQRGVSEIDCETVADHSFGVAILGYTIAEEYRPDLDANKVMKLGLFHEVGEIYAGDVTPRHNVAEKTKVEKEFASAKKVFAKLSHPEKYVALWQEFEEQTTPEAVFVKQMDRLEMGLQASLYEYMNYKGLDEFFGYVQEKVTSPELKTILNEILKTR